MAMNRFVWSSLCILPALLPCELVTAQEASDTLVRDQQAVVRPRPEGGETVTNRERPELDPLGIRAGAFIVRPRLDVREVYNDNIFSDDEGEIDDFITLVRPKLQARSNWRNHQLNLRADANIGRYGSETDENFEDFSVSLDGRLDITRRNTLRLGGGYNQLHEGRGSPDDVRGIEPTVFSVGSGFLTYAYQGGRASLELDGSADRLEYDNVRTGDGRIINTDERNRTVSAGGLKIGYEFFSGYTGFVKGAFNRREYDSLTAGIDRDSEGYLVELGTAFDLTGLLFGDLAIGFRSQDFDEPSFATVDGVTGNGTLTWTPTGLTTVTGTVTREIRETIVGRSSSIFSTSGSVLVDHELLRNLLLQARAFVIDDDFEGIDRSDRYVRAGFGAAYLMNRYIH
ncbi:MAG: outer membrane beta-barrel protein, partial [Gammaproteobacteria bacterium]